MEIVGRVVIVTGGASAVYGSDAVTGVVNFVLNKKFDGFKADINTGISTYLWVLTNRKEKRRKGRVQLIDARNHWVPMEKSLGNKRRRIGDPSDKSKDPDYIGDITKLHGRFEEGASRWVLFDKDGKVVTVTPNAPTGNTPAGSSRRSTRARSSSPAMAPGTGRRSTPPTWSSPGPTARVASAAWSRS